MTTAGRDRQAGMTLIEVLVVLAVIGVGTGAVMLGMGGADRSTAAQTEAVRLASHLSLGVDEAMISGLPLALRWDQGGYSFVQNDAAGATDAPDAWPPAAPQSLALHHDLAAPLILQRPDAATQDPVILPVSGAAPAVTFRISGRGSAWIVAFDGFTATAQPEGGT